MLFNVLIHFDKFDVQSINSDVKRTPSDNLIKMVSLFYIQIQSLKHFVFIRIHYYLFIIVVFVTHVLYIRTLKSFLHLKPFT